MMNLFKSLFCGLLSVMLLSSSAFADAPGTVVKAELRLGRPSSIYSPSNVTGMGKSIPRQWFCVEAKLKVDARPVPKTGYIDGLTITFYMAVKDPEQAGKNLLLKKEIKYVNIPIGVDSYVCAYMAPSTIKRLTGSDSVSPTMYVAMGVTATYNGKDVGFDSSKAVKKGAAPWWTSASFLDGSAFPLLSHNETPFAPFGTDRFPEIAPASGVDFSSTPSTTAAPDAATTGTGAAE